MKIEVAEQTRVAQLMQRKNAIFVFGSNRLGVHGAGAAKEAVNKYGACWFTGEGMQGRSYALPTKHSPRVSFTLFELEQAVHRFLSFAKAHPEYLFVLTKVGCGLAGFIECEVAPLFCVVPKNVELPLGWRNFF